MDSKSLLGGAEEETCEEVEGFPVSPEKTATLVSLNYVTKDTFLHKLVTNVLVNLKEQHQENFKDTEEDGSSVQDSSVQKMDHKMQTDAVAEGHVKLSTSEELDDPRWEKRKISPLLTVCAPEELQDELAEEREAGPDISADQAVATMQNEATIDKSLVRLESNVIVHTDDELKVQQQEEEEGSETQESLIHDYDDTEEEGVNDASSFWKWMTCCLCIITED